MPQETASRYSAERADQDGIQVVRLFDSATAATASIVPSVGNIAYELTVNGKNALYFPFDSLAEFQAQPRLAGNPILWPWANRLDRDAFFFEGAYHALDVDRGNIGRDGSGQPIHGLVRFSDAWEVVDCGADDESAWASSLLDYSAHDDLAAQFPYEHRITMTYRLSGGELAVETLIENRGVRAMPVSLGYHPYFQLHDAPRDEWTLHLPVSTVWNLNDKLTPTGQTTPLSEVFPQADSLKLEGAALDHVFGGLERAADGFARFRASGRDQAIEVLYGPGYDTAVVYAPPGRDFFCFEPMVGITNAFNLAHEGKYDALQSIPPGDEKRYEFRIRVSGF